MLNYWESLLFFSLIAVVSVALPVYAFRLYRYWLFIPLLLALSTLFFYEGIAIEMTSWFFVSLLITILLKNTLWKKVKYLVPFLFLLWANIHGSFPLGIVLLLLFIGVRTVTERKILLSDIFVLLSSIFITLVNPYGINLWHEVWMQMSDTAAHQTISEWQPLLFSDGFHLPILWVLLVLASFLFVFYRRRYSVLEFVFFLFFLLLAFSARRQLPFLLIYSMLPIYRGIGFLSADAVKIKYGALRLRNGILLLIAIVLVLSCIELFFGFRNAILNPLVIYPNKAIVYLENHPTSGQIFSINEWGGYLEWKLPQKQIFSDGLTETWRWHAPNSKESDNVFMEYKNIIQGKITLSSTVEKYNIDTLLLYKQQTISKPNPPFIKFIDAFLPNKKKTNKKSIYTQIEQMGWKIVYKDSVAVIYRKQ